MKKLFIIYVLLSSSFVISQGKQYAGPEDPAGDPAAEREGYMTGNRVLIYFKNTTELSDWPATNASGILPIVLKISASTFHPS